MFGWLGRTRMLSSRMKHTSRTLFVALAIAMAACGTGDASVDTTSQASATAAPTETVAPPESAAPTETTAGQAPTTEGTVAETAPTTGAAQPSGVDGPVAPDFEFTLDDGSTFVLSEEAMPVYMVFWAEW